MKGILFLLLITVLHVPNLIGQKATIQFGINANPISLLSGDFEGIIAVKFLKRFRIKTSVGYAYSNVNSLFYTRVSCLIDDGVDDRLDKGWFNKNVIDFTFLKKKNFDTYSGVGFFYTKFETSGVLRPGDVNLENSGEIMAGGIVLGSTFKKWKSIQIDFGIQGFYYGGSLHHIGNQCKARVPGIDSPGGGLLFTSYAYVMF